MRRMRTMRMPRETRQLFKVRRRVSPMAIVIPLLVILLLACWVVYDNSRIVVDKQTFSMPSMEKSMDGMAVLQMSDIRGRQFGAEGESLDSVLKGEEYDLVVMTGDLAGKDGDLTGFYQALDYFAEQGKRVYFITGETDPAAEEMRGDGSFGPAEWVIKAQETGAVYLDVPQKLYEGETSLWLMPASALVLDSQSPIASLDKRLADETIDGETAQSLLYKKERYQAFAQEMESRQQNDLTIMLSHLPCLDKELQAESTTAIFGEADLILAGHHLGGQICLPVVGALKADNDLLPRGGWFPETRYLTGLNEVNATYQYVSTGLGVDWEGWLDFRTCNPPKVSIITLTRKVDA